MNLELERLDMSHNSATVACTALAELADLSDDPITVAYTLAQVRALKRTLSDIERTCERQLDLIADERKFDVDGLGRVEIRRRMRRWGWDHDTIATAVTKAVSAEDGEDPAAAAIRLFRECVTTGAAKRAFEDVTGIMRDEVCQVEPDGVSVQIHTPESAPRIEGF